MKGEKLSKGGKITNKYHFSQPKMKGEKLSKGGKITNKYHFSFVRNSTQRRDVNKTKSVLF